MGALQMASSKWGPTNGALQMAPSKWGPPNGALQMEPSKWGSFKWGPTKWGPQIGPPFGASQATNDIYAQTN